MLLSLTPEISLRTRNFTGHPVYFIYARAWEYGVYEFKKKNEYFIIIHRLGGQYLYWKDYMPVVVVVVVRADELFKNNYYRNTISCLYPVPRRGPRFFSPVPSIFKKLEHDDTTSSMTGAQKAREENGSARTVRDCSNRVHDGDGGGGDAT